MKPENIKVDDFFKWTSLDHEGRFTQVGQVTAIKEDGIMLSTEYGLMAIKYADGVLEKTEKPSNWGVPRVMKVEDHTSSHVKPTTEKKERAPRAPREPGGESKRDRAIVIYKSMMVEGQHPKRADVIDRFVKELGMTPAGASTYQNVCKKELGG